MQSIQDKYIQFEQVTCEEMQKHICGTWNKAIFYSLEK